MSKVEVDSIEKQKAKLLENLKGLISEIEDSDPSKVSGYFQIDPIRRTVHIESLKHPVIDDVIGHELSINIKLYK